MNERVRNYLREVMIYLDDKQYDEEALILAEGAAQLLEESYQKEDDGACYGEGLSTARRTDAPS